MTAFISEWGRYMYNQMPQGFLAGVDICTRRYDEIMKDIERKVKCIDDALLYDYSIKDAFYHTWDFLEFCALNGIVINDKKFQFCKETVIFIGLKITPSGIAPSNNILSAIKDFPTLKDITGARSWFVLVNQVAWAHSLSDVMKPFRDLIKPNNKFIWTPELNKLFTETKSILISMV